MSKDDLVKQWGKCCLSCHFLSQWDRAPRSNTQERRDPLTFDQRKRLARGDEPQKVASRADCVLGCAHNVWDANNWRQDVYESITDIVPRTVNEDCFFLPYRPGMPWPTAKELERREANRREAGKDRQLTRRAFQVAFGALLVSITAFVANLIWNIWVYSHPAIP